MAPKAEETATEATTELRTGTSESGTTDRHGTPKPAQGASPDKAEPVLSAQSPRLWPKVQAPHGLPPEGPTAQSLLTQEGPPLFPSFSWSQLPQFLPQTYISVKVATVDFSVSPWGWRMEVV